MRSGSVRLALAVALALAPLIVRAQAPATPPSATPPASPAPATPSAPAAPATPSAPAAPATPAAPPAPAKPAGGLPTLVPEAGDTGNVDEVVLPEKAALSVSGKGSWDEGFKTVQGAFAKLNAELKRIGIAPAGRPIAIFTDTTDDAFQFQAMIPIATAPTPAPDTPGFKFVTTPSGKAYRFVHKGAYDDIDSTYETITTYLDSKDIVAKDAFIEEYANDAPDSADGNLEINIYVQPK